MARVAVRATDVRKRFVIRRGRAGTLQEAAISLLRGGTALGQRDEFWALDGVTFDVEAGRTLGIIGRNGAGKSTLLKLLAGTMRPTSGTLEAAGKVFGLLELAAGFHPDLSGRENVFLNGAFLGRSRADMARRLDEIVAFSELEAFIDQPVKHYSSGMYMRLGFAVALSVEPDVMIVDEVLAVGDAAFRQKCLAALAQAKAQGRTILFVTHDPGAVRRFCDEAIWLDQGKVRAAGTAVDVLRQYLATTGTHGAGIVTEGPPPDPHGVARGPVALRGVHVVAATPHDGPVSRIGEGVGTLGGGVDPEVEAPREARTANRTRLAPGDAWEIRVRYEADVAVPGVAFGVAVHREGGTYVMGVGSGLRHDLPAGPGEVVVTTGSMPIAPGLYGVSAGLWLDGASPDDGDPPDHRLSRATTVDISVPGYASGGIVAPSVTWSVTPLARPGSSSTPNPSREAPTHPAPPPPLRRERGEYASSSIVTEAGGAFRGRFVPAPPRLVMGANEDEFLGPGWHAPEDWPPAIRWCAPKATAFLTQSEWATALGVTLCRPHARQDDAAPVGVTIRVDGEEVGRLVLGAALLEPYTFPVVPLDAPREITVTIEV
ncbi:MAG: ABC transporter ATP-binding protein, partial [Chloroflexi bacterium]|nr:ABC transporter ATP-binding protein [Chloroflexota bacterium]